MFDLNIADIISIIGLLVGGGSIGGVLTWRYTRRMAAAQAQQAEIAAAKDVQDVYQQMVSDVVEQRKEQKQYITELKDDRQHLRQERDELRTQLSQLDETVRGLQRDVARNGRMVECMRPYMCGNPTCRDRVPFTLNENNDHNRK